MADVAFHPVVAALHRAFGDHRPVCLSPDMVWLLVAQGAANHVNAHAEALRPRFVRHRGKGPASLQKKRPTKPLDGLGGTLKEQSRASTIRR